MPTLTPLSTMDPSPRVEVLVAAGELNVATSTITIKQISEAGEYDVRDAVRVASAGGVFVRDYEPPLGIPVTYQAEQFDAAGVSLGLTGSATTIVAADPVMVVMQDPLAPLRAVRVKPLRGFAGKLSRARDSQLHRAGRRTLALMGEQGLLEQVPLQVWTGSLEDSLALEAVLDEGTLLVRSSPALPLPPLFYTSVPTYTRDPYNAPAFGEASKFEMAGDQVTRSTLPVIEPAVTWARYKAAFATWGAMKAAYSTWLDAKQDPPPEA